MRKTNAVKQEGETWSNVKMTAIATALRAPSESAQLFFSKHHHRWELQCTLAVHTAFKTESNAIGLAMIASATALLQASKYRAARAVNLAGVATNCIGCGRLTMAAGSVTLVQECERFSPHKEQVYPQSVQPRFWTGTEEVQSLVSRIKIFSES